MFLDEPFIFYLFIYLFIFLPNYLEVKGLNPACVLHS